MKKLLLILFTLCSSFSFSQGTWTPRTSMPDSARESAVGFAIGNYGYAGIGIRGVTNYKDFWQFNSSTNSWSRKTDFPGSARYGIATFVIGNNAYLVTGAVSNGGNCVAECWEYNAITDTWLQKTNFPGTIRLYATGFAIGGKGYVGTGSNEYVDYRKDFYAYDTSAGGSWTRIADFPGMARIGSCGLAVNGKGYVCFGQDSGGATPIMHKDMWEYDTNTNAWAQKSDYPGLAVAGANGFAIGNNIYVGGGQDTTLALDSTFWQYNTTTDSWVQQTDIPSPGKVLCSAFAVGDTGYVGLGEDKYNVFNNLNRFYPNSNTGINNAVTDNSEIKISPNPFKSECFIAIPKTLKKPVFVLCDWAGRKIGITIKNMSTNYILYRDNLKAGEYLLSVNVNDKIYYKKIIVID